MRQYSPLDERVHIYGRSVAREPLPLFWTGSGIEVITDGTELWFELESDYDEWEEWVRIELDGVCVQRRMADKGRSRICVFRGLTGGVRRRVRLLKEAQPRQSDQGRYLLVHGILTDGRLYPVPAHALRLEFVGDSLTSGEGLWGPREMHEFAPVIFSTEGHYAVETAGLLNADFRLLSQSGWGVYCSWDNLPHHTMPPYYHQVCGVLTGEKNRALGAFGEYDFTSWKPDAVVINLGSNDGFSLGEPAWIDPADGKAWKLECDGAGRLTERSRKAFEDTVVNFLKDVRKRNPQAYILWAYGMVGQIMAEYLEEAVEAYKRESRDARADFFLMPEVGGRAEWTGSNNHPNAVFHRAMAELLAGRLREKLGA